MRISFPRLGKRKWGCLSDGQLASFVEGKMPPAARERVESHLAHCLECRESVALILRSERSPLSDIPPAWLARVRHLGSTPAVVGTPRWGWATAMAGLLVAAVAMTFAYRPEQKAIVADNATPKSAVASAQPVAPETDQVRNLPSRSAMPPVLIVPADGASVSRNLDVRWQALPAAVSYEVRVLDADGDTVWSRQTRDDHLLIPAGVALHKGEKYFLQLSANLPTGKRIHAKAVSFRMEAGQEP